MTDKEKKYVYKLKRMSLERDELWDYIRVRAVSRFHWGKYDKFIPLDEAMEILDWVVFYPENKDLVMSKNEFKQKQKQRLVDSILFDMED